MKTIFIIVICVILFIILLFVYCALKISSFISQRYEKSDF